MKLKTILVAVDFSERSLKALEYATALAADRDARLLIVHVKDPPPCFPPRRGKGSPAQHDSHERKVLDAILLEHSHLLCDHRILVGDTTAEILDLAESERVDLIVLATHGRAGLRRALLGSVAEAVVRQATCPVLICKQNDPDPLDFQDSSPQKQRAGELPGRERAHGGRHQTIGICRCPTLCVVWVSNT